MDLLCNSKNQQSIKTRLKILPVLTREPYTKAVQQRYFSASSLKFATLTIGKKKTVQKETQSQIATACMRKSEHSIVMCIIDKNDLTG
jgi:hypothetical protein